MSFLSWHIEFEVPVGHKGGLSSREFTCSRIQQGDKGMGS